MAVIKKDGGNMALPIAIKRGNPIALDTTQVWYDKAAMEAYAASGATAYVGQYLSYVNEEDKLVEAYMIANEQGSLVKLASTTASGDVSADITALQGRCSALETRMTAVEQAVSAGVEFVVVESLPATGQKGKIYLVAHSHGEKDIYDEYIWVEEEGIGSYEKLGNTDVDLSDYYDKDTVDGKITNLQNTLTASINTKQDANSNLTALGSVTGAGLIKRNSDGSMVVDSNSYVTATGLNQTLADYTESSVTAELSEKVTANENAIAAINNETTGILAQAKKYTDDNKYDDAEIKQSIADNASNIANNASAITNLTGKIGTLETASTAHAEAIAAINDAETGILKTAKDYADNKASALTTTINGVDAKVSANTTAIEGLTETVTNNQAAWAKDTTYTFGIVENNLVVTPSEGNVTELAVVTDAELATTLEPYAKTADVNASLAKKQDNLTFNTDYNAITNKVATMEDVKNATSSLAGAMHFRGTVDNVPSSVTGYAAGDVILVGNKEYVCDGESFIELGDESIYAVKGSIKDADIAADAGIQKSKLSGAVQATLDKADSAAQPADVETAKEAVIAAAATDATTKADAAKEAAIAYADDLAGNYATAAQGEKADSAIQSITTSADSGLVVTKTGTAYEIKLDELILNGGSATE